jgi:hypothetical protein
MAEPERRGFSTVTVDDLMPDRGLSETYRFWEVGFNHGVCGQIKFSQTDALADRVVTDSKFSASIEIIPVDPVPHLTYDFEDSRLLSNEIVHWLLRL